MQKGIVRSLITKKNQPRFFHCNEKKGVSKIVMYPNDFT